MIMAIRKFEVAITLYVMLFLSFISITCHSIRLLSKIVSVDRVPKSDFFPFKYFHFNSRDMGLQFPTNHVVNLHETYLGFAQDFL